MNENQTFNKNIVGRKLFNIDYVKSIVTEEVIVSYDPLTDRVDTISENTHKYNYCLRINLNRIRFFDKDMADSILHIYQTDRRMPI